MTDLLRIANHPYVRFCFPHWDTARFAFAHYYLCQAAKSPTFLSLRDTIERYRTSDLSEIAKEMAE